MSHDYYFIEPVDTLSMRGNKLFGEPGSYGESDFPPRPSVLSGAFRSVLFVQCHGDLDYVLNSPFMLSAVFPARMEANGRLEHFLPLPADIVVTQGGEQILRQQPTDLASVIQHNQNHRLPMMAVLRQKKAAKAEAGWLLNTAGIQAYLDGEALGSYHLCRQEALWLAETRVGIGLDACTRTVDKGKLFSVEHTVPLHTEHDGAMVGLLVSIQGKDEKLPAEGFLRLGGDGRAARYRKVMSPVFPRTTLTQRFKLVLLTPGLFEKGWLPDGVNETEENYWLEMDGLRARLACASIPRAEVISGWDIAKWQPKPAEQVAPAGSVYWFDQIEGDTRMLDKLARQGVWKENNNNQQRRVEGYNRILLSAW